MSIALSQLTSRAQALLSLPNTNYSELQKIVAELDKRIKSASDDILLNVPALILAHTCKTAVQQHPEELKMHARWEKLGHNPEFIETHPDCVKFLLDSGVAFQISGFGNSLIANPEKHHIAKDVDGHPLLLLEGVMTRWELIKERFEFIREYDVLHTKGNKHERWTYTSQAGITAKDTYYFDKPFPTYELEEHAVAKLQAYAQTFQQATNPNPDANYVLQICTSMGVLCTKENALFKKMGEKLASHYSIRVITPEGQVYSFGMRRDLGELEFLTLSSALGEVKGRIVMNDFDEHRPHSGRWVTTLPLTKDGATAILEDVIAINARGTSFDYFDANCVNFTTGCLRHAGVEIDTRSRLESCLVDLGMSILKNVPLLGACIRKVRKVASDVLNCLPAMPTMLKSGLGVIVKVIFYVPTKIGALFKNTFLLAFGWTSISPTLARTRSMRSIGILGLFNEDLSNIRYPRQLMRWQKLQRTSHCHEYTGRPQLAIIPPQL